MVQNAKSCCLEAWTPTAADKVRKDQQTVEKNIRPASSVREILNDQ